MVNLRFRILTAGVLAAVLILPHAVSGQVSVTFDVTLSSDATFQSFVDRVNSADTADREAIVDSFMNVASFPHIEGDTATFIHRGEFTSVNVPGDANGWAPDGFPMQQLADTDFWYRREVFEPTARLDYKLVENGSNWILDPRNPATVSGGFGPNSELAMSQYEQPYEINYNADVDHGMLADSMFYSAALDNTRRIQIYLPAEYNPEGSYGVMVFHDGSEYLDLGSTVNILDNLIGRDEMAPIIGVFIPPVDRNNEYAFDKTDAFEDFIIDEIMPWIQQDYAVATDPELRGTTGVSFGGLISTQLCYNNPDVFGLCGPFSPAYWASDQTVMNAVLSGEQKDIKFYIDWGTYEPGIAGTGHAMKDGLIDRGYDVVWNEWFEGHSWGNWRAHIDEMLKAFFPPIIADGLGANDVTNPIRIHRSYPNPFSESARIDFELYRAGRTTFHMFDMTGRRISEVSSGVLPAGRHTVDVEGQGLASGVYVVTLVRDGQVEAGAMLVRM